MGKHRPVSDRIAEAQAQLARLVAKASMTQIKRHPEIAKIDEEIKNVQVSMLKYNRWAAEGEAKIANFEARAEEWSVRLHKANQEKDKAAKVMSALRVKRKQLVADLAKNIEVDG